MGQKKAWIYCRVAHHGPDSAEILAAQQDRLEAYAKKHDFEIVGTSSDIGSGLTMDRPGLRDFQVAVEDEAVDVLLVHRLSRLGRDIDKVIKYWYLLRDFDVSVHTADCGEVDLRLETLLHGVFEDMKKLIR